MDEEQLRKRRRLPWWVRWFGIPLILVAIPIVVWGSYYLYALAKYNAAIREIKDAGEPLTWAEMIPPQVPDEENGLLHCLKAADDYKRDIAPLVSEITYKMFEDECPEELHHSPDNFTRYPRIRRKYPQYVRQLLEKGEGHFVNWLEQRKHDEVSWSVDPEYDLTAALDGSDACAALELSRYLHLMIVAFHERGDHDKSLQGLLVLSHFAKCRSQGKPVFLDFLASMTTYGVANRAIESVSHTLLSDQPAKPEQLALLRLVIRERMSSEALFLKGFRRSLQGERIAFLASMRNRHITGEKTPSWLREGGVCMPLYYRYAAEIMRMLNHQVNLCSTTTFPEVKRQMRSFGDINIPWKDKLGIEIREEIDILGLTPNAFKGIYNALANTRMATTALAMRLYELETGKRPERLSLLVPDYLPAIPEDPFGEAGTPIRYKPTGKYPLLYCIGPNGVDEGGKYADDPDSEPVSFDYDQPFFLTSKKPPQEAHETANQE